MLFYGHRIRAIPWVFIIDPASAGPCSGEHILMKKYLHGNIAGIIKTMSLWHFVLFSMACSEAFTAIMSVLLRGSITYDYLITGGIVSLFVSSVVMYLISVIRENEKEASRFSDTILNSMREAVCVIDVKNFQILSCNDIFLKELGFKEEDVIGKACYEITHQRSEPCTQPDGTCPTRATVMTGEHAAAEHVHFTKDGKTKYAKVTTSPIKDEAGEVMKVVHVSTDITETKQLQQELERLATTDKLTDTYNRLKYDEIIQQELERAGRYGRPLSLIMLDIDRFKNVNDRYGHLSGDHILRGIADIVKGHKRKMDYLFRWGGEEFMFVAPETNIEQAASLAERIRRSINDHAFNGVGNISASFGITELVEGDTDDALLKRVDDALYKAKINGRNRVETSVAPRPVS